MAHQGIGKSAKKDKIEGKILGISPEKEFMGTVICMAPAVSVVMISGAVIKKDIAHLMSKFVYA